MQTQTIYLRLTLAAPLHLGCAEVYEPTSFLLDEKRKELIHFDAALFLGLLDRSDREKFSAICRKGTIPSILELMKFIRLNADRVGIKGDQISVTGPFVDHYRQTMSLPMNKEQQIKKELNNFKIARTAFDPLTAEPYIPGSAVKGAIRTAVLNFRNRKRKDQTPRGKDAGKKLQEDILSFNFHRMETDPFRLVKVSDFIPAGEVKRCILYAVDCNKAPKKMDKPQVYQIVEIVEPTVEFIGAVTISQPVRKGVVEKPLSVEEILTALKGFYGAEKVREDRELTKLGFRPPDFEGEGKCYPIRIGRHSGAECVTVGGHRNIRIIQGKKNPEKWMDHATTIWMASEKRKILSTSQPRPFGWVLLEEMERKRWTARRVEARSERENRLRERCAAMAAARQDLRACYDQEKQLREEEEKAANDPAVQRAKRLKDFVQGLPDSAGFPGCAGTIIEKIKSVDDPVLQLSMINVLQNRFKQAIKKGLKNKKKWAIEVDKLLQG